MGIFNRWVLKPIVRGGEKMKKEVKRSERERMGEGSIDGGGQGDKVSCRVFAPEEASFQRGSEQQKRE